MIYSEWAVEIIEKVASGEIACTLDAKKFPFFVLVCDGGWRIALFNDAGEIDYVEGVEHEDGRVSMFDDFHPQPDGADAGEFPKEEARFEKAENALMEMMEKRGWDRE